MRPGPSAARQVREGEALARRATAAGGGEGTDDEHSEVRLGFVMGLASPIRDGARTTRARWEGSRPRRLVSGVNGPDWRGVYTVQRHAPRRCLRHPRTRRDARVRSDLLWYCTRYIRGYGPMSCQGVVRRSSLFLHSSNTRKARAHDDTRSPDSARDTPRAPAGRGEAEPRASPRAGVGEGGSAAPRGLQSGSRAAVAGQGATAPRDGHRTTERCGQTRAFCRSREGKSDFGLARNECRAAGPRRRG